MEDFLAQAKQVQWFPGHMAKTLRQLKELMPKVDIVIEITDARIPESSRNPELPSLIGNKPHIILLNKSDLADPEINKKWIDYYKKQGINAVLTDCKSGGGLKQFMTVLRSVSAPIKERNAQKGMPGKTITVLVAGIPNTGKSSFINRMAGKAKAKVEDRAGVTRQNQRYTIDKGIDMIDTPGLLWPKFEDPAVGDKLAFTGGIKDTILDIETLAARLLTVLAEICPEKLTARYKLEDTSGHSGFDLLEMLGRKRGMLLSGNEVDTERAANTLLDEFRGGKLGRISLEVPTDSMEDENDKP